MPSRRITATSLAITFLLVVAAASRNLPADGKSPPLSVNVEDIGAKVQLIGRLGQPLGKMMTVSGRWFYPAKPGELLKDDSMRFLVTHVNQKRLTKDVEFDVSQLHVTGHAGRKVISTDWREQEKLDGQKWTMRLYESGQLFLEPQEFRDELNLAPVQVAYFTRPFVSELHGYVVKE